MIYSLNVKNNILLVINVVVREDSGVFLSLFPSFNLLLLQAETFDIVHSLVKRNVYRITYIHNLNF